MLFLFLLVLPTTYIMYKIQAQNIIYNSITRKYKKWRKLKNLVSSQHKDLVDIYSISFKMILQALYISLLQYFNDSVKKLDKNTYQIEYVVSGKLYKMICIPKKGPCPILQIRDENENDITEEILPYYGPNYDWYSISFIPQFFKCKKLIFELDNGEQKIFDELEYINLV